MRDIQATVEDQLRQATRAALGEAYSDTDPLVRPADPQFGDYQANLALSLAKATGKKPRDIAQAIAGQLAQNPVIARAEVAGPGFINVTLADAAILSAAGNMWNDARLGVSPPSTPDRVLVDYGSPNLAKEMHIGHLRSSIIGDAIARILRFAGHDVLLQNHIGDWGTQFGMLLEHLLDTGWDSSQDHSLSDLNRLYLEKKRLKVEILGRGVAWLDTGTHEALLQAANFIQTIEMRQGLQVASPEEVAYRQGWISAAQLSELGAPLAKTAYGQYLLNLVKDG